VSQGQIRPSPSEGDAPRHHCGLFGVYGDDHAAEHCHLGLYALQHRGQESAGIAASDGRRINLHKGMGLVSSVFADTAILDSLPGRTAIAHNRYSTTGSSNFLNAQPLVFELKCGQVAAAHNGNLVNAAAHSAEEIRAFIGADSLGYLSVEGMLKVVPSPADMCTACFTGDYPTEVPVDFHKEQFHACGGERAR